MRIFVGAVLYLPVLLAGSSQGRTFAGLMWRRHIFAASTPRLCLIPICHPTERFAAKLN
jgi:hypothetical protein